MTWESRKGAGRAGKKCFMEGDGEWIEERWGRYDGLLGMLPKENIDFWEYVKYSFEMLLIHLKENLPVQFVIFTNGNQLLRCSHRETDGWIYPGLVFCQEILWMENMVDENWGRLGWRLLQGSDNNDLPLNPHGSDGKWENGEENRWCEIYGIKASRVYFKQVN